MPIINYKGHLIEKVKDGSKPHTIRFGKRIYQVGQNAIHITGMRTSGYVEHRRDLITSVEEITVSCQRFKVEIHINGKHLTKAQANKLAINDGFKNLTQFIEFFQLQHGTNFTLTGQLIQWQKPITYTS
tara:strand:+ start:339 stop:725 length:387 start_codon:yes stop_codon:yes gene_type:complete